MMIAIFGAIPLVFVALWFAIAFASAHIGGWATLSSEFRATQSRTAANRFGAGRGSVGRASYRGGVSLVPDANGLWMEMSVLLRFSHPTLFVPWKAVSPVEERSTAFGVRFYKFQVQSQTGPVKVIFYNSPLAKAINAARETHLASTDEH